MNIFVTSPDPQTSAIVLPDKYIVKMPVETCQMISLVYSKWYRGWGDVLKKDGTCLLYTSPSPRDLSTSRMPSSA